ncbi:P-loop containing nucleoside triphosphate hydrolase protein [Suillus subaureus]|uniref:P-loop containing nucleoside triphosphate hydrolase protein n=1 Tax=Suillus subaureus TaxID=48587 RepID=A0A9P7ELT6_9AGAM|nr:P-loop containing nucleoside triphosphate hydrolase protein [Suillus subaureus]KAG1825438.1 P-loop containing nucleoside triphosphate hydrolase protein [Suillus subaureus]
MAIRAGKVDPQDARRVKHSRIGIWDLYEERQTHSSLLRIPGSSIVETCAQMVQNTPYVVRMLKDVLSIRRVQILLPIFLVMEVSDSLIPAVSLWYVTKLVPTAIETHTMDPTVLIHAAVGHLACKVAACLLQYAQSLVVLPMDRSMKQFYAGHMFHSTARLDFPTIGDPAVQKQLSSVMPSWRHSVAWQTIEISTGIIMTLIRMLSQLLVLFTVLQEQQDGLFLVILGCLRSIILWYTEPNMSSSSDVVWIATTTDRDYMRMQGLEQLVDDISHRKELVAGNLSEYTTAQFRKSAQRVGDDAGDFRGIHSVKKHLSVVSIFRGLMHELPQIIFTLWVVQKPKTILLSLASFILIEDTSRSFMSTQLVSIKQSSLAKQFANVRKLYEIENVENKVVDGIESFPENQQSLRSGVSVEFRNVSFQYPGAERCALRNVSFKIGAGHLCVIVGTNGSGKSTILKLVSRIYDPTEGTILIDNRDIKTLRLADLRAAMSILFQDYTHFPLSIHENIGLGNPALAHDDDKIREAARLGGAEDFIDELPDGFNAYVRRPAGDIYPDFPWTPSGQPIDFSLVRSVGGIHVPRDLSLSGGQMQRLAVSRTFMRSLATETESSVGMLLFDEPSASLDPTAEHADLFERLRKLRGNKTMIFSTHRFGNLTRHADLILYMDESVQEQGTHDELMKKGGEYARIWNLQAKPFL